MPEGMVGSPMAAMVSLKSSRSSALSMASAFVPMRRDAVLLQKALLVELHRQRQARLAAETGEKTVWLLLFNDALDGGQRERLEINLVREGLVGHDRRGVGVDEHDVHARVVQHAARLRAGVVKLRRLTDHDRAGADDHDFADA